MFISFIIVYLNIKNIYVILSIKMVFRGKIYNEIHENLNTLP